MNRLFFAVLAVLIISAPPAVPAEERTAAQMEEEPAAYDPAWDIPASEPAACDDVFLGEYTLTAYCPCTRCCGKDDGITATGTLAAEGRTIAVDPRVIPYGTHVWLYLEDGTLVGDYYAEDTGGNMLEHPYVIDIYMGTDYDTCIEWGVKRVSVYVEKDAGS